MLELAWHVHVAPRWRDVRVAEVVYSDVQAWVSELAAKRRATIVKTAHSVLARILDDAVRDRLLAANAAVASSCRHGLSGATST